MNVDKSRLVRKICVIALSVALMTGTAVFAGVSGLTGDTGSISVSAASVKQMHGTYNSLVVDSNTIVELDGDLYVLGDLKIESGTWLNLKGYDLTVGGNLIVEGALADNWVPSITNTSNVVVKGNVLNYSVFRGQGSFTAPVNIKIGGDFQNYGYFDMCFDDDYLLVEGNFIQSENEKFPNTKAQFNGMTGTFELKGDFYSDAGTFYCRGTHKTILSGSQNQNVNLLGGVENYGFATLMSTNDDLTFESVRIEKLGSDITANSLKLYCGQVLYQYNSTSGSTLDLDGHELKVKNDFIQNGDLDVNGGKISVGGNYIHQDGFLYLHNGTVSVDGDYKVEILKLPVNYYSRNLVKRRSSTHGLLRMTDDNDYFLVSGDCYIDDEVGFNEKSGAVTNGTIEIKGDFYDKSFYPSGNNKIKFSGNKEQNVTVESGYLNIITESSNKNVNIVSAAVKQIEGNATFKNFNQRAGYPLNLNGNTLTISENFAQNADVDLNGGKLSVGRTYLHQDGSLNLNKGTVKVGGDYRLQKAVLKDDGTIDYQSATGNIKMVNPEDYFLVEGNFYTYSSHDYSDKSNANLFTDGILELKGDFCQLGWLYKSFMATDNHKVILSGNKEQNISFEYSGSFNILNNSANKNVNIAHCSINKLETDTTFKNFTECSYLNLNGHSLTVSGQFTQNGSYSTLDLNGGKLTVSGQFIQSGTVDLNGGKFSVGKDYIHYYGALEFNKGTLIVGGDYRLQSFSTKSDGTVSYSSGSGYFDMVYPEDYMLVEGDFYYYTSRWPYFKSKSSYYLLTDGTIEIKGDFLQGGYQFCVFYSEGNNKVVFSGSKEQKVSFQYLNASKFNIVCFNNPSVSFESDVPCTVKVNASEITLGESIKVTEENEGGYKYAVYYKKAADKNWVTAQDFKDTLDLTIKPAKVADYQIKIVRSDNDEKIFTVKVNAALTNKSSLSASTFTLGNKVTVNAAAEGGAGDYTYAVYYKKTTDTNWVTAQDFKANAKVTIKPALSKDYQVKVIVKDKNGKTSEKTLELKPAPAFANNSTLSADTIVLGNTVTVKAAAQGGAGSYTYAVYYKKSTDTKWVTAQSYNANATVSVKPAMIADYQIKVIAKDSSAKTSEKILTVKVNNVLTNKTTLSADTIVLGNTVTVKAAAQGGTGGYTYAVYYKKTTDTKWVTAQDFKANATVSVKPAKATDYQICVKIKDSSGTVVKNYYNVTVK